LRNGAVPLQGLAAVQAEVRVTAAGLVQLARHGAGGLWGPLGDGRRTFNRVARIAATRLDRAADSVAVARTLLGETNPRRYLVALQNNAEMRDQGSVLSYLVAEVAGGKLQFGRNGSVADLMLEHPSPIPVPPGTNEVFGFIRPAQVWQSVNASADFAWSGRAMASMYHQATGQPVDGVIAIDVPTVAALLSVVGPVPVEGISEPVSSANAVRILLHDQYEGVPPGTDPGRRERLAELTRAVMARLTGGAHDAVALGRIIGEAAAARHVRLWTSGVEEALIERTGLGGGPATTDADRTFHLAVENRTATKLDYYVNTAARMSVRLTKSGAAIVHTTVAVQNLAPAGAAPSYALGPDPASTRRPGDYIAWVLLWGAAGSRQEGGVPESGLDLSQRVVPLAPGETRQVELQTVIPGAVRNGHLRLRLVPQPRLQPTVLEVDLDGKGWHVKGPPKWAGAWDRVLSFDWQVRR
jgi:hypothetical protein